MSRALLGHTIAALSRPRRLIPIALVCTPLVIAQRSLSRDPLAMPLGVAMCAMFVLAAPYLWRRLVSGARARGWTLPRRGLAVALYGLCGLVIVFTLGAALPRALGIGMTFLTGRESLFVSLALFWVGGWGLGRDIELEDNLARAHARARALAREAEQAQLLALRSHLDPHFLFNTLNAIAEWCREDGEVAERAILKLSAILRTVLTGVRSERWTLARELALVRDLLELHLFRDDALFSLRWDVPEGDVQERVLVPPMILLPLVENAVKHGPAAGHRGLLSLSIEAGDSTLRCVLENPGPFDGPRDGGQGVPMVRRRLELAYDGAATLELGGVGERTRAVVTLPLERADGAR